MAKRGERNLTGQPLAELAREVRHLLVGARSAGSPLPDLARTEARLRGRVQPVLEESQVHVRESLAHRVHAIRVVWAKGHAVTPTSRDIVPSSGERQLLDAVLDAAASLIVVVDAEGRLVRWNRACERLLGYRQAQLEAPYALLDLMPAAERREARKTIRAVMAGDSPLEAEFQWRTRTGRLRLIAWSMRSLTGPGGEVTYFVGTGIDVTDARNWSDERTAAEARLRHMADHDGLTGLFNRRRFEEELERHIAQGRRYGMSGALLILDLNDFKQVNDRYGHRAGDRVLSAVAMVLRHRLRESDIVARFGGDEFSVLMPVGGAKEATELADLLAAAVQRDVPAPAGPLSASVGIALFEETSSADEILSCADDAMYVDKRTVPGPVRHLRSVD